MRAKEVTTLWIENKPVGGGVAEFYEYTDGIISIDIRRGMNEYLGPHTQVDTGSLIITSRNPNLDPMATGSLVRYKNRIKVMVDGEIIFIGRIENIDVKYNPKNEPPLITITAFDYVRDLIENRWTNSAYFEEAYDVFTQIDGAGYGGVGDNDPLYSSGGNVLPWILDRDETDGYNRIFGGASCTQLMQYIDYRNMIADFELSSTIFRERGIYIAGEGGYTETLWDVGNWIGNNYYGYKLNDTFYSIFAKTALANLGYFYCKANGQWNYVGRTGLNPGVHRIDFSSEGQPGTESYRTINITDGFERIFNKITATWQEGAPYNATPIPETTQTLTESQNGSIGLWGLRELTLNPESARTDTINPSFEDWHETLFEETAYPHREVASISWNGMNNHNVAKLTDINDEIHIQYVSDLVSISADYRIVGIRHRIDADDWIIEYILRNYNYAIGSGEVQIPVIVASDTSVTNIEPVNFSISNGANFFDASWNFGDGIGTSTSFTPTYTFTNVPIPGQTYAVTVTCTDLLGRTVTSLPVQMTVTGQTPILYNINRLDKYTEDEVGQNWFRVNASNYDTLTWQVLNVEKGAMWAPGTYTSTNHRRPTPSYPYGAFIGADSFVGGSVPAGSTGEVTMRVTGTNIYGSTFRDITFDSFSTGRENLDFNARYIRISQKYTGTVQYAFTGAFTTGNYHDINPNTFIKNIYTHNFNGLGSIIQAVNNNGTITTHDGTPFNLATHSGLLTDLNDNTGIRINTNLGTLVSANKYRMNPDWYIVIDLGSIKSLVNIFPEFNDLLDGFPFRTKSTSTGGDIYVSFSTTQSNGGATTGWTTYASHYGFEQTNSTYWDAGSAVALKRYYLTPEY